MASRIEQLNNLITKLINSKTSPVVTREKYDKIKQFLKKENEKKDPKFSFWIRSKHFQLLDFPALGVKDAVVVPAPLPVEKAAITSSPTAEAVSASPTGFLRVVHTDDFFDVMTEVHGTENGHAGRKKCEDYVSIVFFVLSTQRQRLYFSIAKCCCSLFINVLSPIY